MAKKKSLYPLYTIFRFDANAMKCMNIPQITLIDDQEELWKYIKLDRHKKLNERRLYMVSTYGRIYDIENRRILTQCKGSKSSVDYYRTVKFTIDGETLKYFVHRLVALAFLPVDEDRPFVNHIDGNPSHNYLWNLEWVTLSENVNHAVMMGLKVDKRGEQRPNAMWTDDEVRLVCEMMEQGHKATYIYHALGDILKDPKVKYERVHTLYKHIIRQTHWTHISKDYDIDFTRFNYKKELSSYNDKQQQLSQAG